ncbi:hypothetical protein BX600DRAFT_548079 [Xylariales sp. PMI_506]|nr:hypothetical protein BX600DRAFT_548079 [Xylariales sp. PMI_506]
MSAFGVQSSADPLAQWYTNNDGPWIGIETPQNGAQNAFPVSHLDLRGSGPAYHYREQEPSECDTIPPGAIQSDSGYGGSATKQSIATNSVYEDPWDRNQETQSLAGHLSDFHFNYQPLEHMSKYRDGGACHPEPEQDALLQHNSQSAGKGYYCEPCRKTLKTHSELKKHQCRHTRPFRCDVVGCKRTEGFSTTNDLDRHKRSVHPREAPSTGKRYRCPLGSCKGKTKIWPRADNFRAHLKRMHGQNVEDNDLEKYLIQLPATFVEQDVLSDLAGMQTPTIDMDSNTDAVFCPSYWELGHEDSSKEMKTSRVSPARPIPRYSSPSDTSLDLEGQTRMKSQAHLGNNATTSIFLGRDDPLNSPQYVSPNVLSQTTQFSPWLPPDNLNLIKARESTKSERNSNDPAHECSKIESPTSDNSPELKPGHVDSQDLELHDARNDMSTLVGNPEKAKAILDALQKAGMLKVLGYTKEVQPANDQKDTQSDTISHQGNRVFCDECKKDFARPCELKKHAKRHSRPYGCTFDGCDKRFGSKNDWKRHENSQHFLLEIWKCNVKRDGSNSGVCGKVSHRRETFRQHLTACHQLSPADITDKRVDECRVGKNCDTSFWCGFCEKIIPIKRKGLSAWAERYNHIDDHFSGRNVPRRHIDEWKGVDPDAPRNPDKSESDSESCCSPTASSEARDSTKNSAVEVHLQRKAAHRRPGSKRKAEDEEDTRQARRLKPTPINEGMIRKCCNCGEGNIDSKMSPVCVSSECQHLLCTMCK